MAEYYDRVVKFAEERFAGNPLAVVENAGGRESI
jgi:predicted PhzF superfamily epimerase YddE/YHI9